MSQFDLKAPAQTLVRRFLEAPDRARDELARLGFRDVERAFRNLGGLVSPGSFASLPACLVRMGDGDILEA